jgi:hypothetical protein
MVRTGPQPHVQHVCNLASHSINDTQEVPLPVFLTVVDLLMDKELAEIRQDPAQPRSEQSSDEQKKVPN